MDKDFAIIVGVLFVVIMLSLAFSAEGITGFYRSSSRLIEYPYEGFAEIQSAYQMGDSVVEGYHGEKKRVEMMTSSTTPATAKKVEGFQGLQSGPIEEQAIGFMYNNESNTTCKGYGYTTSKGNVCLSDADIRLLTTRGMNATGVSDQIGA
jgi:hypothetical protein